MIDYLGTSSLLFKVLMVYVGSSLVQIPSSAWIGRMGLGI